MQNVSLKIVCQLSKKRKLIKLSSIRLDEKFSAQMREWTVGGGGERTLASNSLHSSEGRHTRERELITK